jgi:hypothetical protein
VIGPDPAEPDTWHVKTTVWLVDNEVPAGFVGSRPWPSAEGKVFEYTLVGDPHTPTGGSSSPTTNGRIGRPFMVWYPDPGHRNVGRQLSSPALDYTLLRRIVRGGDLKPLFDPRIQRLEPLPKPPLDDASSDEDCPPGGCHPRD